MSPYSPIAEQTGIFQCDGRSAMRRHAPEPDTAPQRLGRRGWDVIAGVPRKLVSFDPLSFGSYRSKSARGAPARDDYFSCQFERGYRIKRCGEPERKTIGGLSYGSPACARSSKWADAMKARLQRRRRTLMNTMYCFPVSDSSMVSTTSRRSLSISSKMASTVFWKSS